VVTFARIDETFIPAQVVLQVAGPDRGGLSFAVPVSWEIASWAWRAVWLAETRG
jgi:hypothetical protein